MTVPAAPRGCVLRCLRPAIGLVLTLALFQPLVAAAHHAPGHAASEGARAMTAMPGDSGRATQRLLLLSELTRVTEGPTGAASTRIASSLSGSVMPHPWLSLGAQFPWVVVREAETGETLSGYGDTGFEALLTPKGESLEQWVPTVGLRLSLPTRSFELTADPGKIYQGSLFGALTRQYSGFFWQAMLLTSLESRPAGRAWEGGAGFSLGYQSQFGLSGVVGGWLDARLRAYCASVDGNFMVCEQGRVTEQDRPTGAARGYLLLNAAYALDAFGVTLGVQLPVTPRRDVSLLTFLGFHWRF